MATQENRAMVSETSICNLALGWLGANEITSLESDPHTNAELCRNNYPFVRDLVLAERNWTFATARHTSVSATEPDFGMGYVHAIPLNWLTVPRVFRDVSDFDPNKWVDSVGWRREGEKVIAREDTVYMWGRVRITDTAKFSQHFIHAVAQRLAADICTAITHDTKLQGTMYQYYLAKLSDAAAIDGGQGRNEKIKSDTLINARIRGG